MSEKPSENKQENNNQPTQPLSRYNQMADRHLKHQQRDQDKKRFPPNKKDGSSKKIGQKTKIGRRNSSYSESNNSETKNDLKNIPHLKGIGLEMKNLTNKPTSLFMQSSFVDHHPVGQSKRQKLMHVSPNHTIEVVEPVIAQNNKQNPQ